MTAVQHGVSFHEDEEGWWEATCECGWSYAAFPAIEDAADSYGDHRSAAGIAWAVANAGRDG